MKINNNMSALFTLNELNRNGNKLGKVAKKAASGMRINSAGDDASGYSISERMRIKIRALGQCVRLQHIGKNACADTGAVTEYRECADRAQYDGHCRGRYSGDY